MTVLAGHTLGHALSVHGSLSAHSAFCYECYCLFSDYPPTNYLDWQIVPGYLDFTVPDSSVFQRNVSMTPFFLFFICLLHSVTSVLIMALNN